MSKKEKIIKEAYRQFTANGYADTKIDDIATSLKMSKKTIYTIFRTKEDLFVEVVVSKVDNFEKRVNTIYEDSKNILEKVVSYIETVYLHTVEVTLGTLSDALGEREQIKERMVDYLNIAVFSRLKSLLDQAEEEGLMKLEIDKESTLMMYWETLSTFVFSNHMQSLPEQFLNRPFNELISSQLLNFYRGFLNEKE